MRLQASNYSINSEKSKVCWFVSGENRGVFYASVIYWWLLVGSRLTFLKRGRARLSNEGKSTAYCPTVYSLLPWDTPAPSLRVQMKCGGEPKQSDKTEQVVWFGQGDNPATWFWTGGPALLSLWRHQSPLSCLPLWPPLCKTLQLPLLMILRPHKLSGLGWFSPHLYTKQMRVTVLNQITSAYCTNMLSPCIC